MKSQDFESATSNMHLSFQGNQGNCHGNQIWTKKTKLHWFQFCARNRGTFRMKSQDIGLANSNMLSQFSRERPLLSGHRWYVSNFDLLFPSR